MENGELHGPLQDARQLRRDPNPTHEGLNPELAAAGAAFQRIKLEDAFRGITG